MKTAATLACRALLLLALALAPVSAVHSQETIRLANSDDARDLYLDAETLLASGETENAFELLRSYESEFTGNPYFDYLLGVASLDSGRSSLAILSLQRAAAGAPDFAGARLELARAYFEAAAYSEARPIFVALLDESPPPAVHDLIGAYINAIDTRPTAPPTRFLPYGELLTGHDSNANASGDDEQFLNFTLSPENQETSSMFVEAAAGFDWSIPRGNNFGWFIGARASYRDNPDAPFVDAGIVSGLVSMNWRSGAFYGRATANAYGASRDGESNESYGGGDLMLGLGLGEKWDLSLAVRSGSLRYDESIEILDVDRTLYTLATTYQFAPRGRLNFEVISGKDDEKDSASPYGNSKNGGRIAVATPMGDSASLVASLGTLSSDYDGLFFGTRREDQQVSSLLQLEFYDVWVNDLMLAPRLRYIDNDSDVDLYSYERVEIGLMIRWAPR